MHLASPHWRFDLVLLRLEYLLFVRFRIRYDRFGLFLHRVVLKLILGIIVLIILLALELVHLRQVLLAPGLLVPLQSLVAVKIVI